MKFIVHILILIIVTVSSAQFKMIDLDKLYFQQFENFAPTSLIKGLTSEPLYLNQSKSFSTGENTGYRVHDYSITDDSINGNIWLREIQTQCGMKNETTWWVVYKNSLLCDSWSYNPINSSDKSLCNYSIKSVMSKPDSMIIFRLQCSMNRNGYGSIGYKDFVFNKTSISLQFRHVVNTFTVFYGESTGIRKEKMTDTGFTMDIIDTILNKTFSKCGVKDVSELSLDDFVTLDHCIFSNQKFKTVSRDLDTPCFIEKAEGTNK